MLQGPHWRRPICGADGGRRMATDETTDEVIETANARTERGTRRRFVFGGALAAASSLLPRRARGQRRPPAKSGIIARDGEPALASAVVANENTAAPPTWATSLSRLVRRVTYGATSSDLMFAQSMGYQGYLNYQLNYKQIDDTAADSFVASTFPQLALP